MSSTIVVSPLDGPFSPPARASRGAPRRGRGGREAGPLLVATDGRDAALPAVQVAAAVAARLGGAPQALAVLEPVPTYGAAVHGAVLDAIELDRAAAVRDAMRAQMRATLPIAVPDWPAQVAFGHPARTIADVAVERKARLVLLGLGRHALADRLFGTETALQVLRLGRTPVLGVAPRADGAFRRAVVAVDFGPASVRAAELAYELLEPGGTLSLVHVKSRLEGSEAAWEMWDAIYGKRVAELMARLVAALRRDPEPAALPHGDAGEAVPATPKGKSAATPRRDVAIGTAVLVGDPSDELLDYAERVGADLVCVGSHGAGFMERLFVGSVATELLRRTSARLPGCSVLACPAPSAPEAQRIERQIAGTTELLDPAEWKLALEGFAIRNVGRRATLEVDDAALGAQAELHGYALVGATFDPRDLRVELFFGDPTNRLRHLTRTIPRVASLAVLTAPDGRDEALRVEHQAGQGQTLVKFEDEAPAA